jgi:hypothetical protein
MVLPDHFEGATCHLSNILDMFLTRHGIQDKTTPRSIRVDQGGELARSEDFRKFVSKHSYVVEPTGSDTPSQNGARGHPRLCTCVTATPAARILRWRSRIRHAFLIAIDGNPVHTIGNVQNAIATLSQTTCHTARFTFTHDEIRTNLTAEGVPQPAASVMVPLAGAKYVLWITPTPLA